MKRFACFRFVFAVVYAITVPSFGRKNARQVAEHAEAWRGIDENSRYYKMNNYNYDYYKDNCYDYNNWMLIFLCLLVTAAVISSCFG